MDISNDYITPVELTGYGRAALADLTVNQFSLARFLPNRDIDDLMYRFTRGGEGLTEAATFRAYNTEAPIGSRPGVTRVSGQLPPISRKIVLDEYDRLRQRHADTQIQGLILRDALRMTRAIAARLEMARGEALYTGKITLNENGVIATVDFGRTAGHAVSAGVVWSTVASATVLTDLLSWRDTYVATNGQRPGVMLTSSRVLGYMLRNAEIRGLVATVAGTPTLVSEDALQSVLRVYGLPPIEIYDAQVKPDGGSATKIIPDDRVVFLPTPGDPSDPESTDLGATLLGTTAESLEPDYGIADEADQPGIVVGSYSTKDPVAIWTKAAAIALPVLANPDLTFCADVL